MNTLHSIKRFFYKENVKPADREEETYQLWILFILRDSMERTTCLMMRCRDVESCAAKRDCLLFAYIQISWYFALHVSGLTTNDLLAFEINENYYKRLNTRRTPSQSMLYSEHSTVYTEHRLNVELALLKCLLSHFTATRPSKPIIIHGFYCFVSVVVAITMHRCWENVNSGGIMLCTTEWRG